MSVVAAIDAIAVAVAVAVVIVVAGKSLANARIRLAVWPRSIEARKRKLQHVWQQQHIPELTTMYPTFESGLPQTVYLSDYSKYAHSAGPPEIAQHPFMYAFVVFWG